MPVKVIYKNRRGGADRRQTISTWNGTERRSGVDRRKLDARLKRLIKASAKDQEQKKSKPVKKSPGNVILRRKGD